MEIAFLTPVMPEVRAAIVACAQAGQRLRFADSEARQQQLALVRTAEVIVSAGSMVDAGLIAGAEKIRLIQKWGIGVDKIDLDAARARGIPVAITAGASAGPVAEHALALMLAVYRRLPLADRQMRAGIWQPQQLRVACRQITGKTVGLLGFGNIARLLAHRLRGFDVEILYHDIRRADAVTERGFGARYVPFDTLLERSDILSLHLPLTDESRGIMNSAAFARMRQGAVLINTARGSLVDEAALHEALLSGRLAGAGLDTFTTEPVGADHPLLALDQVVVTPHSAGSVFDNIPNIAGNVLDNIARFARGEPLSPADIIVPAGLPPAPAGASP
ncbi:2-hydroxyacid dehydrogenase [Bosea sp. NPDC055332]